MDAIECALRGADVDLTSQTRPELADLRECPQSAAFHAEGDVAVHSRWVYDLAREQAGLLDDPWSAITLRLAGLLHDVGKPVTTKEIGPGRWAAHGHDLAGAQLVSTLFATHPALLKLPLGVYAGVHALVRAHMWTYAAARINPGAALRMSHVADPQLLTALWDSDSRGRICDDAHDLADQVAFADLVLQDLDAARPGSHGVLDQVAVRGSVDPRAFRETFRAVVEGAITNAGAASAHLAAAERHSTGGSITYTIGLPGVGKSTWARETWAPATGGVVLSSEGARRRDRRAAAAAVLQQIPEHLAAGRDICVDATHLLREVRDVLITYAGRYGAGLHAVYFAAPLALALQRQTTRPGADAVPAAAVTTMAARLRWPTPDEYQSLTVVEPNRTSWDYTDHSRWLDSRAAVLAHPAARVPWSSTSRTPS
ncbi:AAA family ATPase [Kineosporia sp. NBRC 101731]|uniref:AAA family ATPase n=1 Tax=Kineosporia sp. NBRC 101731 TaxID=3032199 RepID=UPI00249FFE17|nr:AAA family ATPase [Kineosporia sp. NBRC 101731]GLY30849.1 HDIG domain-containing protein [Kineosporia sp. NBRC 101731]